MKLAFVFDRNSLESGNKVRVFFLVILFLVSSCASVEQVKEKRGNGVTRQHNYPYREVYVACLNSLHSLSIIIVEKDRETGVIVGRRGPSPATRITSPFAYGMPLLFGTSGELVGVYVSPIDDANTNVEVVSLKISKMSLFSKDWTYKIHLKIDEHLKNKTSGKGLWNAPVETAVDSRTEGVRKLSTDTTDVNLKPLGSSKSGTTDIDVQDQISVKSEISLSETDTSKKQKQQEIVRSQVKHKTEASKVDNVLDVGLYALYDKDYDSATYNFQEALRLDPDNAKAHCYLGEAYHARRLPRKAIRQYKMALQLEPSYARANYNLALVYKKEGSYKLAIEHVEKALRTKPNWTEAQRLLNELQTIR